MTVPPRSTGVSTGGAWATSEAYAVSLDLDTRKMIPITGEARERMLERVTPGLAL